MTARWCLGTHPGRQPHLWPDLGGDDLWTVGNLLYLRLPVYLKRVWCGFDVYTAIFSTVELERMMLPSDVEGYAPALDAGKGVSEMYQRTAEHRNGAQRQITRLSY